MSSTTPELSLRTALLLTVTAAAIGFLNLSVIRIGEPEAVGAEPASEQATAEVAAAGSVIGVVVDITVPVTQGTIAYTEAPIAVDYEDASFGGRDTSGAETAATAPPTTAPSTAASTPAPTTPPAIPTSAPPTTEPPTTTTTTVPVSTEYLYYSFEGVASTIIVAYTDNQRLEFWSATTEGNWVFDVETNSPSIVEVKFFNTSSGDEAKFLVEREDGELKVKRER